MRPRSRMLRRWLLWWTIASWISLIWIDFTDKNLNDSIFDCPQRIHKKLTRFKLIKRYLTFWIFIILQFTWGFYWRFFAVDFGSDYRRAEGWMVCRRGGGSNVSKVFYELIQSLVSIVASHQSHIVHRLQLGFISIDQHSLKLKTIEILKYIMLYCVKWLTSVDYRNNNFIRSVRSDYWNCELFETHNQLLLSISRINYQLILVLVRLRIGWLLSISSQIVG